MDAETTETPAIVIVENAYAKLNLYLSVTGRRPDGYHLLDSLFAFADLHDVIIARSDDALHLTVSGEWADGLEVGEGNLVLRAAELLMAECGVRDGARLHLEKRMPIAAGLGGGSADAAAALRALNRLWKLHLPLEKLEALGARLGADVPACVRGRPVFVKGVGDQLASAPPMPACGVLLANPRFATPTPAVFRAFVERYPFSPNPAMNKVPLKLGTAAELAQSIQPRGNDLLPAAITVTPEIDDVVRLLRQLDGTLFAGLSGSGATCFALFNTVEEAAAATERARSWQPGWWFWSGTWHQG